MAKTRKVDLKAVAKSAIKEKLTNEFFKDYEVVDCAGLERFTKDTIIVRNLCEDIIKGGVDMQVKLIVPTNKIGNHYVLDDDEEEEKGE